jgi:hypothetical protein
MAYTCICHFFVVPLQRELWGYEKVFLFDSSGSGEPKYDGRRE